MTETQWKLKGDNVQSFNCNKFLQPAFSILNPVCSLTMALFGQWVTWISTLMVETTYNSGCITYLVNHTGLNKISSNYILNSNNKFTNISW